jgi:hypothetical protein
MAKQLELFLQGGLGNQLIQLAYAESLVQRCGVHLVVNSLLLGGTWARLRGISCRPRSRLSLGHGVERRGLLAQVLGFLRLRWARLRRRIVLDASGDAAALQLLQSLTPASPLPLLGYFQWQQAFGSDADPFWQRLAQGVGLQLAVLQHPLGQVVVHVRLGDYLWPQNQRLFAAVSLERQLRLAQAWRQQLGGSGPIHLVSDDPALLQQLLPPDWQDSARLIGGSTADDDFLLLASHRHIVASNSSFSFCAGRLAATLWGVKTPLLRPDRWFNDPLKDARQDAEWRACGFCATANDLGLA